MQRLIATLAIACTLACSGCFTFLGAISGARADNRKQEPSTGMSETTKGLLMGAATDALLIGLAYGLASTLNLNDWGCGHDDCD